jgi:serine-type D-Ala-D-Ala carboxypeptidase/endopeptidase
VFKIILLFLYSTLSCLQLQALSQAELKKKVDNYVSNFRKGNNVPGVIIGVMRQDPDTPGQVLTEIFSYGSTEAKGKQPLDERTIFRIGSITKVFTGSLLANYIKNGEARLDDPAQKFLPDDVHIPTYNTQKITLLDLATHTSGLPLMPSNFQSRKTYTLNDMYDYLNRVRLLSPPGRKYNYSDLGYALLANVLARIGRDSWQELVSREICDKLKMFDTRVELNEEQSARLTMGHKKNGEKVNGVAIEAPNSPFIGSGGLFSSLADMLKWLSYHLGHEATDLNFLLPIVLEPRKVINSTNRSEICLGWEYAFLGKNRDFRRFSKGGRIAGYSSFIAFVDTAKNGVVVLTNGDYPCDAMGIQILKDLNNL